MSAGSIVISLLMKTGSFETDTARAAKIADKRAREIERSFKRIGDVIKGGIAGITLSATITKMIRETAAFEREQAQLAAVLKSTGNAAGYSTAQLNAMAQTMADKSVFSTGQIVSGMTRLLSYSGIVGQEFPEAMQIVIDMADRMGTSVEQASEVVGRALDIPSAGLASLSKQGFRFTEEQKKLVKSLEDVGRVAEAQQIVMSAMRDSYGGAAEASRKTLGGALAALKNQFNDLLTGSDGSLDGMKGAVENLTRVLGAPETKQAFATFVGGLADVATWTVKGAAGIAGYIEKIRQISNAGSTRDSIGSEIRDLTEYLAKLNGMRGSGYTVLGFWGSEEDREREIAKIEGQLRDAQARFSASFGFQNVAGGGRGTINTLPTGQREPGKPPPAEVDSALAKRLLDNYLKTLDAGIQRERDLFASRNRFIEQYNSQGYLSIKDYYDARAVAQSEALAAEVEGYDKQLAALRKHQRTLKEASERAETQGKINDITEKREKAMRAAGEAGLSMALDQAEAQRELLRSIDSVNAQVLELTGNLREAAAIRFDQSNESLKRRFTAEGNDAALKQLETLRAYTLAEAEYTQRANEAARVTDALQIAEDRIAIARQLGATTELEGLRRLGEARQSAVAQLEAIVAKQEAVARASENPALIANAERARVALERLKAEADPLKDKFDAIFEEGLGDAFADFISGAKSAEEAVKSMANSILSQLSKIAAEGIAKDIFGGLMGGSGGIGGLFATMFGGARAGGGDVLPGREYLVGEEGPERFVPRTAGTIIPAANDESASKRVQVTNVFHISQPASRQTQAQIATQAGVGIQRALARNA